MIGEHTGGPNLNVPSQNDDSNANITDVVGNKLDDYRGDSIYARLGVPAQNSVDNTAIASVIGSKLDNHDGNSLYARLDELYDTFQLERRVYPSLAADATVISPAAAWTYGNYATVVPANTITNDFHILIVSIESCTVAAGVFQLELYKGSTDSIITAIRFAMAGGFWGNMVYTIGSGEVAANSQVRARMAANVGAAAVTISIEYFEHL